MRTLLGPGILLATLSLGACQVTTFGQEKTCTGASALAAPGGVLNGASLGARQLALSFDDGPATRTIELAQWLGGQNIRATFFINGQNVGAHPGALQAIVANGHMLANHTQRHRDLTDVGQFPKNGNGNAQLVAELSETDAVIAPFVNGRFLFRAPFGAYDQRAYNTLNASPMSKYVGHVDWDVGGARTATTGADWACFQNDPKLTSKACGDLYLSEIGQVGRGIVLMHDADNGNANNANVNNGVGNTIDMVKYLVPKLKALGYTFVGVDQVPDIAAALPPPPVVAPAAPDPAQPDPAAPGPDGVPAGNGAPVAAVPNAPPSPAQPPAKAPAGAGAPTAPKADPCPPVAVSSKPKISDAH